MIKNLLARRVPQILGLYLGGAWVVVEFLSFLTARYLLSDRLTDLLLVTLLAMLPTVAVVAWFHGTPGKDRWVTTEKIVVPTNAILTAALLVLLFRGEDLGATTTTVTATDEQGATVTRVVPKQPFRKSLAVFSFDNASGDPSLDWMRHGVALLLQRDLEQSPFVEAWSPLDGFEQSGLIDLQRAGFADAVGVPVSLMRDVARKRNLPLILTGAFSRNGASLVLTGALYRTDLGSPPTDLRAEAADLPAAVDILTRQVKEALELPAGAEALAPDLPVAEHFSTSPRAIELYVEAEIAGRISNDAIGALDLLGQATETDPSFAAANLRRAALGINSGQTDAVVVGLAGADQHSYRLLHEEKFVAKALDYYLGNQVDKMVSVYEMHAELYPDDIEALARLAFAYLYQVNDVDRALETLQSIRSKDPGAQWALTRIAELQLVKGEVDSARRVLIAYATERPEDFMPLLTLARIDTQAGELSTARDYLERATVLASGRVDPLLQLASLDLREGRFDDALLRLQEAGGIAKVPRQQARVLETELQYYAQRGMTGELAGRLDALFETDSGYRGIINLLMVTVSDQVKNYVLADRQELYVQRLQHIAAKMEPPLNDLIHVGYLGLYLTTGDVEKSIYHAGMVRALVERFGRDDLVYLNELATARILDFQGDLPGAINAAESSLEKFAQSVHSVETENDRILIRNMLGDLYRRNGDLAAARAVVEKVLETYPAQPESNLILAEIASARNDIEAARRHLAISLAAWEPAPDSYPYAQRARALRDGPASAGE